MLIAPCQSGLYSMSTVLKRGVPWRSGALKDFNEAYKQMFSKSAKSDEYGLKSLTDSYHKNRNYKHLKHLLFKPDYENLSNFFTMKH